MKAAGHTLAIEFIIPLAGGDELLVAISTPHISAEIASAIDVPSTLRGRALGGIVGTQCIVSLASWEPEAGLWGKTPVNVFHRIGTQ